MHAPSLRQELSRSSDTCVCVCVLSLSRPRGPLRPRCPQSVCVCPGTRTLGTHGSFCSSTILCLHSSGSIY